MPRKPKRANGRATYERILDCLDEMLRQSGGTSVSLKDLAQSAQVPVASVYHFFPDPDAALAGLVERYIRSFHEAQRIEVAHFPLTTWQALLSLASARSRKVYEAHPVALRLLLGPNQCASVRKLNLESMWQMAENLHAQVRQHFGLPVGVELSDKFANAIMISDSLWALSFVLHGKITDEFAIEAERAASAYLTKYLGEDGQ